MKNKSFFKYDANLTSVITMELNFILFPLRCWFLCITSLAVTSSMLKTSVKFWVISFKFWLHLCPIEFWVKYLALSYSFPTKDNFEWFCMGRLGNNIPLMLDSLGAPFFSLHILYYLLMAFPMMLSVISLYMLKILLSTLSVIRHLIWGSN